MAVALANAQRRRLLVALLERDPSERPLSEENFRTGKDGDLYLAMRHAHLPKLADYGFVRWDEDRGEVERGPAFDEVRPLLDLLVEHETEVPSDWV